MVGVECTGKRTRMQPVWFKNSCGLSVIEVQEAAEVLAGLDFAG